MIAAHTTLYHRNSADNDDSPHMEPTVCGAHCTGFAIQ